MVLCWSGSAFFKVCSRLGCGSGGGGRIEDQVPRAHAIGAIVRAGQGRRGGWGPGTRVDVRHPPTDPPPLGPRKARAPTHSAASVKKSARRRRRRRRRRPKQGGQSPAGPSGVRGVALSARGPPKRAAREGGERAAGRGGLLGRCEEGRSRRFALFAPNDPNDQGPPRRARRARPAAPPATSQVPESDCDSARDHPRARRGGGGRALGVC